MTEESAPATAMTGWDLVRHGVATIAYRGGKTLRGCPAGFAEWSAGPGARTPAQLVAHIGDLFDWALAMVEGRRGWKDSTPLPWDQEVERFFAALAAFDRRVAAGVAPGADCAVILQGPIADALTHVGQLGLLRRLAGAPVRPENYARARIAIGQVGADQPPAVLEFG